ncbi:hemolysin A [Thermanaerovibrio acidaminovorans DSM 6589]|uniref:Hemolysin A n=1 Tax=Thermanaerovibrio acidaminovorans (strain ATCC 49978 / DSM 6589 / Su883) TaxID=525903 RepID=D1BA31_THEAS|nr:hemolysin A [Thermanaerovibrio acidaminovorans DSM 6589]
MVRLDALLVKRGLARSRDEARELIETGLVRIDGLVASKGSTMVGTEVNVSVQRGTEERWVSRGAYKLLRALEVFQLDPFGRICVDVGASTGGFTQVLLRRGASRVYSVDVGYGQMAWEVRNDPRVVVMERTNARHLSPSLIPEPCQMGVCDASFISLKLIMPPMLSVMDSWCDVVTLVKPQFEVGRERVGKKGVVRDPALHMEVLVDMIRFVEKLPGWWVANLTYSPIRGPEGNIEFLMHVRPGSAPDGWELSEAQVEELVQRAHGEVT